MQIRFLIGPAGSGKTHECVSSVQQELLSAPEGLPLIFLAPKQATFQVERQVLANRQISGFSRLSILSFERLAWSIFDRLELPEPRILSEEGRIMVLRALLLEQEQALSVFGQCCRRHGFAQELSRQIREFQQHHFTPARLRQLAQQPSLSSRLKLKLNDLAQLYEAYLAWLNVNELSDGDAILSLAAEALQKPNPQSFQIGAVWLDGFAQLTPQERLLLVELLKRCQKATLAFCLENTQPGNFLFSPWTLVSTTVSQCADEIEGHFGKGSIQHEILSRTKGATRFSDRAALEHLEAHWADPKPYESVPNSVRMVACEDPEAELTFIAREILRHVRAGGRYLEIAVLLRSFDHGYGALAKRIFTRYGIPFFLDHRENVAHHPLAELTRGAIRTFVFHWRIADWFGALKSGLASISNEKLDELENDALARGWEGAIWKDGLKNSGTSEKSLELEELRKHLVAPFLKLEEALGSKPSGIEMRDALKAFWTDLGVEAQLENWKVEDANASHQTVWQQMNQWLDNLALAFGEKAIPLQDWLPILEAGLSSLTVGVIPPVIDQVLIGRVDRSRNPDLKVVYVAGMNEGVFPTLSGGDRLLSELEREALAKTGCELASLPSTELSREQFYGYIACTRAREQLVLTYVRSNLEGSPANPSRFLSHIQRLFPKLFNEQTASAASLDEIEDATELLSRPKEAQIVWNLFSSQLPERLERIKNQLAGLATPALEDHLQPEVVKRLYGTRLETSVSALEKFAACPWQFFISKGLRVKERDLFQLDVREKGRFQHGILERFHRQLQKDQLKWRDLTVEQARERIKAAAEDFLAEFKDGLLLANEKNNFAASAYIKGLQNFISLVIEWFKANQFDPEEVELPFGEEGADLPGLELEIEGGRTLVLRGRIDRIDLFRKNEKEAYFLVLDYKSGNKKPDVTLFYHGMQQQLAAYLVTLARSEKAKAKFKVEKLIPAGMFFLPLTPALPSAHHRSEALEKSEARFKAHTHKGLFNLEVLDILDKLGPGQKSYQFSYQVTKDGLPYKGRFAALRPSEFESLLEHVEGLLKQIGNRVFKGEIKVHPYKKGSEIPCEYCQYLSICRFDPWEQEYNILSKPEQFLGT